MKHHALRDLAKFTSGLVVGDFICWLWLATHQGLPAQFLGITFNSDMVLPGMVVDLALFIVLVHYGWNVGKAPLLENKTFFVIAGTIFGLVALAHLLRIFFNGDVVILGWYVPVWLSWIATAAAGYLSYMSFHLSADAK